MIKTRLSAGSSTLQRTYSSSSVTSNVLRPKSHGKDTSINASFLPSASTGGPLSTSYFGGPGYTTLLQGIVPDKNPMAMIPYYRDCYYTDGIAGATVDMSSTFPFSDFSLTGLQSGELDVYNDSLSRLNMRSLMSEISAAYLVDGAFIGTLVFDPASRSFQDVLVHDTANAQISMQPLHSLDPVIKVNSANALNQFLGSDSPYVESMLSAYPKSIIEAYLEGNVALDPLSTLFVPRRGLQDSTHTSYLHRVMPSYLFEKVMYRGTLIEAHKRQRSTTHIKMGDENWIPSDEEIAMTLGEFQRTEMDPLGAWIATRQGIDISEIRCISGDSLISTNNGLVKISDMVQHDPYSLKNPVTVELSNIQARNHEGKLVDVAQWHFQGIKPVQQLVLADGTVIKSTTNHKFGVVSTGCVRGLVEAGSIQPGDMVVRSAVRHNEDCVEEYKLNITAHNNVINRKDNVNFIAPEYTSPELAYCLALIISEGWIGHNRVEVANSDLEILNKYSRFMKLVFGVDTNIISKTVSTDTNFVKTSVLQDQRYTIVKKKVKFKTKVYTAITNGVKLIHALDQLGLHTAKKLRTSLHSPAYRKSVPDCILKSSTNSRIAFIAGYLDGDGSVSNSELKFSSMSYPVCSAIHSIITDLGISAKLNKSELYGNNSVNCWTCSTVAVSRASTNLLANRLDGSSIKLNKTYKRNLEVKHQSLGIPAKLIIDVLLARETTSRNMKGLDAEGNIVRGSEFITDDGSKVFVPGGWKELFNKYIYYDPKAKYTYKKVFQYAKFRTGELDKHLDLIRTVSRKLYKNILSIVSLELEFINVVSVSNLGKEPVYDLTMEGNNAPIFTINRVVTKNSGGDFWKWTDIVDTMVPIKLRALGISEAFLSGDASYSTAESAVNSFTDSMLSFRQFLTYKVFQSRVFPLIAVLHNLYKDKSRASTVDETIGTIYKNLGNINNLKIPTIQWHKSLEGKDSESQFDMLERLSEKGFVIPLRMWASSAGLDMSALMRDLAEDAQIKAEMEKMTGKRAETIGNEDKKGFDDNAFLAEGESAEASGTPPEGELGAAMIARKKFLSSHLRPSTASSRIPILARDMTSLDLPRNARLSKSGANLHANYGDHRQDRIANDKIIKSIRALKDPEHAQKVREARLKVRASGVRLIPGGMI